jgi:four helix bundle protein
MNDDHSESNAQRLTPNAQRLTNRPRFDLEDRLLDYAAAMIRLVEKLPRTPAGAHVGGQLLRSGTSPLFNHGEAQAAESVDDFIHKFRICLKELHESRRSLRLIKRVPLIRPESEVDPVLDETEQLIRIFVRSIQTAQKRKLTNNERHVPRSRSALSVGR